MHRLIPIAAVMALGCAAQPPVDNGPQVPDEAIGFFEAEDVAIDYETFYAQVDESERSQEVERTIRAEREWAIAQGETEVVQADNCSVGPSASQVGWAWGRGFQIRLLQDGDCYATEIYTTDGQSRLMCAWLDFPYLGEVGSDCTFGTYVRSESRWFLGFAPDGRAMVNGRPYVAWGPAN